MNVERVVWYNVHTHTVHVAKLVSELACIYSATVSMCMCVCVAVTCTYRH